MPEMSGGGGQGNFDVVFLITVHSEYTGGQLEDSTEGLSLRFNASTDTYKVWDRKSMK